MTEVYRTQFSKAYYNIGMIYDRLGDIAKASAFYKQSIAKCEEDEERTSTHYLKAMTNYAVTLEKMGKRDEAVKMLDVLKDSHGEEIRVFNNLGIIQKRSGNHVDAEQAYMNALAIDEDSFFPNYNLGVLKATQFF